MSGVGDAVLLLTGVGGSIHWSSRGMGVARARSEGGILKGPLCSMVTRDPSWLARWMLILVGNPINFISFGWVKVSNPSRT